VYFVRFEGACLISIFIWCFLFLVFIAGSHSLVRCANNP
jgi:hypothetical protein